MCGLLGLERKRKRRKREGHKFHRRAKNTLNQRTMKKLNGKQSWYKTNQVTRLKRERRGKNIKRELKRNRLKKCRRLETRGNRLTQKQ